MLSLFSQTDANAGARLAALDRSQAIIEFDLDGIILTANRNFLDTVGYTLDEIRGKHHSVFVDPDLRNSPDYAAFWKSLKQGEYQAGRYRRFGKGGREIWIEASYNPLLGRDGKPFKIVKFATDITRQMQEQAELKGQVEAIRKSQAVIAFDLDGNILEANANFLAAVGYSLDEIVDVDAGVPEVEIAHLGEALHRRPVCARHGGVDRRPLLGVEAPVPARDREAGDEALDVPLPGSVPGLVEVVDVEELAALRRGEETEVGDVRVAAAHDRDPGIGLTGEIVRHQRRAAAVEGERRVQHA